MKALTRYRPSPGVVILGLLVVLAIVVALIRYIFGIGAISNLNDAYPWGLWISFDLLCGVATAAGAFITASAVYIFRMERFRPILRPAILTGFLGYLMVVVALLVDLGRPERIWHLIIYWNPHSVLFEVGWCVMLYTTVLALEFSPMLFERLGWKMPLAILHRITIVLVLLGTLLSTLHQSSLGSMFMAMPSKVNPLWFSPLLPLYFFLTAAAVGPAMVIVESYISARVFWRGLEVDLIGELAKAIPILLSIYLVIKVADITLAGEWAFAFQGGMSILFWLEILLGVVAPIVLLSMPSVRNSGNRLLGAALLVVLFGVVLNRFNVSLIGWPRPANLGMYLPHVMELAITVGIVSAGVLAYGIVAKLLPLFAADHVAKPAVALAPELARRSPFLIFPDAARTEAILALAQEVMLEEDQLIFQQGQPAQALYVLLEGRVKLYTDGERTKETRVGTINPGEPFGISALIEPFKLTASARAESAGRALKIDAKGLRDLCEADPQLGQTLAQRVAQAAQLRTYWTRMHLTGAPAPAL